MKRVSAVVMAAGLGKRMHSKKAKVLHQVAGRPMVWYVVSLAQQVADSTVVVLGHQSDEVRSILGQGETGFRQINIVLQTKQLGTGDAVKQARAALRKSGKEKFHERVRKGFMALAKDHPHRIIIIDAGDTIDTIAEQVAKRVQPFLSRMKKLRPSKKPG